MIDDETGEPTCDPDETMAAKSRAAARLLSTLTSEEEGT